MPDRSAPRPRSGSRASRCTGIPCDGRVSKLVLDDRRAAGRAPRGVVPRRPRPRDRPLPRTQAREAAAARRRGRRRQDRGGQGDGTGPRHAPDPAQCYEGLDVAHAVYEWNYSRQLLHIRAAQEGSVDEEELFGPAFLVRRPLLEAIESDEPVVLLID